MGGRRGVGKGGKRLLKKRKRYKQSGEVRVPVEIEFNK